MGFGNKRKANKQKKRKKREKPFPLCFLARRPTPPPTLHGLLLAQGGPHPAQSAPSLSSLSPALSPPISVPPPLPSSSLCRAQAGIHHGNQIRMILILAGFVTWG